MPAMSKPIPYTIHAVHTGDLAYAAMDQGTVLVPVRVERVHGDVDTDPNDIRVTVTVTGTREPFRRGEVLHELPARQYIVARKATGIRIKFGGRIVLGRTIVIPPDMVRPDCGHVRERPDGIGTGYATDPATGRTMCYACADTWQLARMSETNLVVGYLSADRKRVTTWTGGTLAHVMHTHDSPGNHRRYVVAVDDVDGAVWRGSGPRESGTYVTLHRVRTTGRARP